MHSFGNDFYWSMLIGKLIMTIPPLLDATTAVIRNNGYHFFEYWCKTMTCCVSKKWVFRPDVGPFILFEFVKKWLKLLQRK